MAELLYMIALVPTKGTTEYKTLETVNTLLGSGEWWRLDKACRSKT